MESNADFSRWLQTLLTAKDTLVNMCWSFCDGLKKRKPEVNSSHSEKQHYGIKNL